MASAPTVSSHPIRYRHGTWDPYSSDGISMCPVGDVDIFTLLQPKPTPKLDFTPRIVWIGLKNDVAVAQRRRY